MSKQDEKLADFAKDVDREIERQMRFAIEQMEQLARDLTRTAEKLKQAQAEHASPRGLFDSSGEVRARGAYIDNACGKIAALIETRDMFEFARKVE